ncbi:hypothetical protein BCR41DRAFT_360057 [Lobosporangium transversale]|uniref:ENTH domain-containing protein n=1 Tax=Lobosporangium transversale TaxID=64571 RepID=A0A1Y2GDJ8_9FUNG|nr:hypothetical protein BCR41DRAFT_360057 [Lobosporangium transversale]ORZ07800.1 hypothetical protein BCR41DRAFT_360057 [Lobosporangium transversale]|eukprot:XP_021878166.1 hypothetical protein BCR41DRAFT_360057 [Lobosporangium transversale]
MNQNHLFAVKNFSKGYTDMQAKVREATSNDPWGPSGTQMNELAAATFNQQAFLEIMEILDKRMNDKGKNWRHVFKALTVLDYLTSCWYVVFGKLRSENVVRYARENIYIVKTLKEFQYIDEEGKDQGSNEERRSRNAMRDRMSGRTYGDDHSPVYERPGAIDDDRDLQRAIEESKRTARESSQRKSTELSMKEEEDRRKNVEKYNQLSLTEDWEADSKYAKSLMRNMSGNNNAFLQQQPTKNNPYLQFQQHSFSNKQLQQQE